MTLEELKSAAASAFKNYNGPIEPQWAEWARIFHPNLVKAMLQELIASREAWDNEGETYSDYEKARKRLDAVLGGEG